MLLVPRRSHQLEMLDRPDNSGEEIANAMRDIGVVNRFLGGRRALARALTPHLLATPRGGAFKVLDVGTGGADLPLAMARHAERLGRRPEIVAVDNDRHTAALASARSACHPSIRVVRADAFRLPFAPRSFDVVTMSMMLHHLSHERAVRLLVGLRSLGRRAVVVNDLRRHLIPWGFIHVFARLARCDPMFVHDAPLSVLRGFTADELLLAARDSGSFHARVRRSWPYRLVLTMPCGGAP